MSEELSVAVSGMIANESPAPGLGIVRSLRAHRSFKGRVIGLVYDALESATFVEGAVDDTYIMPYPSQGEAEYLNRLRYIKKRSGLDVLIPTLDVELLPVIMMADRLRDEGIATFLPTAEQFRLRGKDRLVELADKHGFEVPRSRVLHDLASLPLLRSEFTYPLMVKGAYYEAYCAHSEQEAVVYGKKIQAKWGLPIIIQEMVSGEEYDVVALGDGKGGMTGAVAMRKMQLSDKGKAWAGVTVADAKLMNLCRRTIKALQWRGPMELEVMKSNDGKAYNIIEINPRFPAWVYLAQGAGQNLPYACCELALGHAVTPFSAYSPGVLFVRAAVDHIVSLAHMETISVSGEWHRTPLGGVTMQGASMSNSDCSAI